jgi:riboflavin transporter FmnP
MVRSIGAVAAGYLIFAMSAVLLFQMSGRAPHQAQPLGFEIASIIWGCVFALVAGWLTARIAARKPTIHAAALAGVIALGALASLLGDVSGAKWSQIAALVVMAPCAWIGGLVSRLRS